MGDTISEKDAIRKLIYSEIEKGLPVKIYLKGDLFKGYSLATVDSVINELLNSEEIIGKYDLSTYNPFIVVRELN